MEDLVYEAVMSTLITVEGLHIQSSRDAIWTNASVKMVSKNNFSKNDKTPSLQNLKTYRKHSMIDLRFEMEGGRSYYEAVMASLLRQRETGTATQKK